MQGVKRRVQNPERLEIFEEEVDEGEHSEGEDVDDRPLPTSRGRGENKFSFQVEAERDRQLVSKKIVFLITSKLRGPTIFLPPPHV